MEIGICRDLGRSLSVFQIFEDSFIEAVCNEIEGSKAEMDPHGEAITRSRG